MPRLEASKLFGIIVLHYVDHFYDKNSTLLREGKDIGGLNSVWRE